MFHTIYRHTRVLFGSFITTKLSSRCGVFAFPFREKERDGEIKKKRDKERGREKERERKTEG